MYYINRLLFIVALLGSLSEFAHSQCPNPLDEETLNKLAINFTRTEVELQPGQTFPFELAAAEGCHYYQPLKACVSWSVEPARGARIDAHTGALTIDKATPHDSVFTVKANVEEGRRVVSTKVRVFTREANPLAGRWIQERPDTGGGGEARGTQDYIEELIFKADGTFSVTWLPFECYKDYWGTYANGKEKGRLQLKVQGGNHVPANIDGDGTFTLDGGGRLTLRGICLGSKKAEAKDAGCDLVFRHSP
jgi:hypothetical protein